jgi:beta-lactamase superfamily II metal-dependent hydrolase
MIKIKMYQANEGDAFLISIDDENFNILVDMGFEETYRNSIRKDLIDLASRGKNIDLLVITHIDNDHISGAVSFIHENGSDMKVINVKEVWHNSYRHLGLEKTTEELPNEELRALKNLNYQNNSSVKTDGVLDIGAKEGTTLASLLYRNKYNWNTKFNDNAVCVENGREIIFGNIKFILLSPNKDKLEKLSKKWQDKLSSLFYDFKLTEDEIFDDAFELFMKNLKPEDIVVNEISSIFQEDLKILATKEETENSAPNGSSIAFIIEYQDRKMLFLADAHHRLITEQLQLLKNSGYELNFEATKVSHHGSNKNISTKLISLFDSKKYLFSTNGIKNSHPELEAISKIILKKSSYDKEIHFNYHHKKLSLIENEELQKTYNYKIKYSKEIIIN